MRKLRITAEFLAEIGACGASQNTVKELWPNGVILSDDQEFNTDFLVNMYQTDKFAKTCYIVDCTACSPVQRRVYAFESWWWTLCSLLTNIKVLGGYSASPAKERIEWDDSMASDDQGRIALVTDAIGIYLKYNPKKEYRQVSRAASRKS